MAIITCPGCDRDVWDGEEACPTCKYPLQVSTNQNNLELFRTLKIRLAILSAVSGSCLFALLVAMVRPPADGFGAPLITVGMVYLGALAIRMITEKGLKKIEG